MQLFIRTSVSNMKNTHVIDVKNPELMKIETLKNMISIKLNIPNIFGIRTMVSPLLDNKKYLSEYKIEDMQTIQLVFPFR